jgi:alpha-D-ribose 1-methylphosphonate 5-triphosphate diphosphatase
MLSIDNARILHADGAIQSGSLAIEDELIAGMDSECSSAQRFDAGGLLLLPGIVDIHGDAFERQIMPRPGVQVPLEIALFDTDRQMIANGITTAFHGVTCSWEPGLRGTEACRGFLSALEAIRPRLACDTRAHLRFETFNLDAVEEARLWIDDGRIGVLAFNDHMPEIHARRHDSIKSSRYLERTGLQHGAFVDLVERIYGRGSEVDDAVAILAGAARARDVPLMSHDDPDGDTRRHYADLGCRIAEFPKSMDAAITARDLGHETVMGAPNIMRGGSHLGGICATALVKAGLCRILASDYYYPSQLVAAFRLANAGAADLAESWRLVSKNPALAAGLNDRGEISPGKRADLILVDDRSPGHPHVVAVIAGGRIAQLNNGLTSH